jgi:2-polyprenyl-3-methyl-5-hydroxy-6-metoxy-1,4-benzoquinol methylase
LPDSALAATREQWDRAAATFDQEPDHGLRDPAVRQAWTALLESLLPARPAAILDIGCGTGSLSVVMAGLGHAVTGIDLSPAMIARARAKAEAAGHRIDFEVMDAAQPGLPPGQFDVIVCRHLLWALPQPAAVLRRWAALLRPAGQLVLIEGRWGTGAGLAANEILAALPPALAARPVRDLTEQPALWGRPVTDERYAIVADLPK